MSRKMSKRKKILLILATLIVATLLAGLLATTSVPLPPPLEPLGRERESEQHPPPPGDIELFYVVRTLVSTINVTLALILLLSYIDVYQKIKSDFTVGLILFSMIFLFYALASNPLLHSAFGFRALGLGPFAMLPDLFACASLFVLIYLSLKY